MEVLRKSAQFISEINATPEKTEEHEPLRKDESADSDDGHVNENVLFEQPKVKTGKRKSTPEKTGEYEPLRKDESTDSDDGNVNENVLFEHTKVNTGKRKCKRLVPTLCWIACIAVAILAVFTVVLYFTRSKTLANSLKKPHIKKPQPNKSFKLNKRFKKTPEWTKTITDSGTESCIRLVDVDEDGRDDVIFGMTKTELNGAADTMDDMKKTCSDAGETFPCAAMLVALRGYDGKELWRIRVQAGPFEMNCHKIDIDKDGKTDCIASGRRGTVVAFDPRKGKVLWQVDQSVVHQSWNFYNVLVMSDFTQDGVPEVLLSHGGDPKFDAEQHKRFSGRLILVDGSNGQSLGRYLNMSRYKETYFSPVLHTTKDGSQYILYGEGGETVKAAFTGRRRRDGGTNGGVTTAARFAMEARRLDRGAFLAISVPDFFRYVRSLPKSAVVPNTRGSYTSWEKRILYHRIHGVLVIYKSKIKGVMTSPTLVDMNNDGVRDIAMSAYDGTVRLYDGETLDIMWSTRFYGLESYSCLAPAYFNDDEHLDFMIHLNRGAWPEYKYSLKVVLDGRNGKVIWQMNATYYGMVADLVMRTTDKHRDAFVFRIEGVNGPDMTMKKEERLIRSSGENIDTYSTTLHTLHRNDTHIVRASNTTHKMKDADRNFYELNKEFFNGTDIDEFKFTTVNDSNSDGGSENADQPADIGTFIPATCPDDITSYMTQFMMLDRSNVHAPNILYQLPSIKFFFNLTEDDKKTDIQDRQNIQNQRKMGGSPRRRRQIVDTGDTGPYCIVLRNDERTTGVIGDVDGDGELDQVAIVGSEGDVYDQTVLHVRIVKINMFDAIKTRGRYRSRLDMYISEEMRNVRGIKPLEQMEFLPLIEQPWTQYMGKSGDGIYRGID
ncbi:hypothetical protein LSAT2_003139 [Lamellibrachia satsuma]|nr:hypothetical protein LSAT2_003139 [Lamellibrachia satsuma]